MLKLAAKLTQEWKCLRSLIRLSLAAPMISRMAKSLIRAETNMLQGLKPLKIKRTLDRNSNN